MITGEKGYKSGHESDHGEKGHHDKEGHKKHYEEEGGHKKKHHDEGERYKSHKLLFIIFFPNHFHVFIEITFVCMCRCFI